MRYVRFGALLGVIVMTIAQAGCEMMPRQLHPNQLWKLNRQDAWDEGYFSVPDSKPIDINE
jgi:hypothetical protein